MKKRTILLFALSVLFMPMLVAQTANKALVLLNKVNTTYINGKGVSAKFVLTTYQDNAISDEIEGTILMQDNLFYFDTPVLTSWYNGKDQWALLKSSDEVSITTPTAEEIEGLNPLLLFQIYKKGYKLSIKEVKGKLTQVEMLSTVKKSDIEKILLTIDTERLQPTKVVVTQRNKTGFNIVLSAYKSGGNYPKSRFNYNPKAFPHVYINDLR